MLCLKVSILMKIRDVFFLRQWQTEYDSYGHSLVCIFSNTSSNFRNATARYWGSNRSVYVRRANDFQIGFERSDPPYWMWKAIRDVLLKIRKSGSMRNVLWQRSDYARGSATWRQPACKRCLSPLLDHILIGELAISSPFLRHSSKDHLFGVLGSVNWFF